ncbi:MAG: beta-galactosidase [Chthoniobacterales bacterium]
MKSSNPNITAKLLTLGCFFGLGMGAMSAATWKVEAEKAGAGSIAKKLKGQPLNPTWIVEQVADASGGAIITVANGSADGETNPIPVVIPTAGTYRVWVRHYKISGNYTSFYALFRDDLGQAVDFHNIDFMPQVGRAKPLVSDPVAPKGTKPEFVWTSFDITFERPMDGTLSFGPSLGKVGGKLGVDCVVISDDKAFDPAKTDLTKIGADPGAKQTITPPKGMQLAPVITAHSSFFAGESDPEKRFTFSLINQIPTYRNYAWDVQMGSNFDHGWYNGQGKYGIYTEVVGDYGYTGQDLAIQVPAPTGRLVNADGKVYPDKFSYSYEPFVKAYKEKAFATVDNFKDDDDAKTFMASAEESGYFDYSDAAKEAYHKWLAQRLGTIDNLNALWRSQYKSFDEIPLPKKPTEKDNKANWFAFREFCSLEYVKFTAVRTKGLREHDTKHRYSTGQSAVLLINSPTFTANGPLDTEDMIDVGFAGEREFGIDSYSTADSLAGCDINFLLSITKDKLRLVNNEFNVHSQDPRQMSQTFWAMIGMGVKGVSVYALQPTANNWLFHMWSLLYADDTPRPKLGVIADANQEVHRLERILGSSKGEAFVKPVALYYSRIDLSLEQPTLGVYSSSIDSPYRIYALLRGLGYTVRWITPKQIVAGDLKDVSAVFMLGANHVPVEAATKIADWVKEGGCLAGDQWAGGFDQYDRTQTILMDIFGIRPAVIEHAMDKATAKDKLRMTTTPVAGGIDPEVLRTLGADELFKSVEEMWDQWDSTHPVAKAVGSWHLSGFELKKTQVIAPTAEVIGMTMGEKSYPGIVLNDYGKGHALYTAIMLGTLFETGPLAFEWDSAREGPGLFHIIDAFLKYSGVKPFSEVDLSERLGWRMRIEAPQVDPKGNIFIGVTSLNEAPLASLPLTLRWPVAAPKMLLCAIAGSRELKQLPFELKDGKLKVTMPGFDTAASLLALNNSDPLVSLNISGAPRGIAGLLDMTPETRLKIKATVWNPSSRKLPAGEVKLFTFPGWFCVAGEQKVGTIEPYSHQEVSFEIEAPAICTKLMLRPIVFKYAAGTVTSTPCTEMVWWNNTISKTETSNKVSLTK